MAKIEAPMCSARVGFYSTPCNNHARPGLHFCGVHKNQEQNYLNALKASREARAHKRAAKETKP